MGNQFSNEEGADEQLPTTFDDDRLLAVVEPHSPHSPRSLTRDRENGAIALVPLHIKRSEEDDTFTFTTLTSSSIEQGDYGIDIKSDISEIRGNGVGHTLGLGVIDRDQLHSVLLFLHVPDLLRLSMVNRHLRGAIEHCTIWQIWLERANLDNLEEYPEQRQIFLRKREYKSLYTFFYLRSWRYLRKQDYRIKMRALQLRSDLSKRQQCPRLQGCVQKIRSHACCQWGFGLYVLLCASFLAFFLALAIRVTGHNVTFSWHGVCAPLYVLFSVFALSCIPLLLAAPFAVPSLIAIQNYVKGRTNPSYIRRRFGIRSVNIEHVIYLCSSFIFSVCKLMFLILLANRLDWKDQNPQKDNDYWINVFWPWIIDNLAIALSIYTRIANQPLFRHQFSFTGAMIFSLIVSVWYFFTWLLILIKLDGWDINWYIALIPVWGFLALLTLSMMVSWAPQFTDIELSNTKRWILFGAPLSVLAFDSFMILLITHVEGHSHWPMVTSFACAMLFTLFWLAAALTYRLSTPIRRV